MKRSILPALALVGALAVLLHAEEKPKPAPGPELDTIEKKVAYSLGYNLGQNLHQQGGTIDADALARGLRDGLADTSPVLSEAGMQSCVMEFQRGLQQKALKIQAEKGKKNKEEGEAFLAKNKTAEGVKTTASGLQYKVVKEGNGEKPTLHDQAIVNYEGSLIDGTVFDSSAKRGMPATFPVGGLIPGFSEGLQLMTPGSTYMFYIPGHLAYGENPPPGPIGPNSVLVFRVELLEVKKAGEHPPMPPHGK